MVNKLNYRIIQAINLSLNKKKPPIALHEPLFTKLDADILYKCIKSGYVSTVGEYVDKFEDKIKKFTGSKHAISTINGTAAIHLALKLLGISEGDEVILPSITFVATANAISYCGATPHFVDSELSTFGIDVLRLEEYLSKNCKIIKGECINIKTKKKIRAIIAVHVFGIPMEIKYLVRVAKKFKLKVIEDAAEALGSYYANIHVGNYGDIGILSFNGNKIITTGGGGMLLTNSNRIAKNAKHLSNVAKKKHKWEYFHDEVGFNYRMPNINASLGFSQILKIHKLLEAKKKLHTKYKKNFKSLKEIKFITDDSYRMSNNWLNAIFIIKSNIYKRNKILRSLHRQGYFCRPAWVPLHKLPMYTMCPRDKLYNAEIIEKSVINIPSSSYFYF
jgi:perosamine synthetase